MTLRCERGGVRLFCGDARDVLPAHVCHDDDARAAVVLTDPPYSAWKYIRELQDGETELSLQSDMYWTVNVWEWVTQWWWPVRYAMRPDGVLWVFANQHYVGFYLRAAALTRVAFRAMFACPGERQEFLLSFGNEPIPRDGGQAVAAALRANTYGQGKDVAMLADILLASPEGLVLDPFCGSGSTLEAAHRLGRLAVGVEIVPDACDRLEQAMRGWT